MKRNSMSVNPNCVVCPFYDSRTVECSSSDGCPHDDPWKRDAVKKWAFSREADLVRGQAGKNPDPRLVELEKENEGLRSELHYLRQAYYCVTDRLVRDSTCPKS